MRYGQTEARESKPVEAVDIEAVRLTAKHLSPTLKAMVRVQVSTGMRPGEMCVIRPCDIERRDDGVWVYRPASHKTQYRGKIKAVPIVGDAKRALKPFLDRAAESYCFSAKESRQWYRDQRTASRTTPSSCGTRVGTRRKESPKRQPGDKFNKDSYNASFGTHRPLAVFNFKKAFQEGKMTSHHATLSLIDIGTHKILAGHSADGDSVFVLRRDGDVYGLHEIPVDDADQELRSILEADQATHCELVSEILDTLTKKPKRKPRKRKAKP